MKSLVRVVLAIVAVAALWTGCNQILGIGDLPGGGGSDAKDAPGDGRGDGPGDGSIEDASMPDGVIPDGGMMLDAPIVDAGGTVDAI